MKNPKLTHCGRRPSSKLEAHTFGAEPEDQVEDDYDGHHPEAVDQGEARSHIYHAGGGSLHLKSIAHLSCEGKG